MHWTAGDCSVSLQLDLDCLKVADYRRHQVVRFLHHIGTMLLLTIGEMVNDWGLAQNDNMIERNEVCSGKYPLQQPMKNTSSKRSR